MTSPERPCAVPIQKEDHQKAFSSRGGSSTPLSFFLEDVQNIPVLPSETRMAYFQQRDICRHQVQLLEAIGEKRTDEQNSLLEQLQKEIQEKEHELMLQNIPLLIKTAKAYWLTEGGGLSNDLIQEGFFGLQKAVVDFDPSLGKQFSTYAIPKIRKAISRSITNKADNVRLPVWLSDALKKIKKVQKNLEQTLEREPTSEEISDMIPELSAEKITECLHHASNVDTQLSLDGEKQYTNKNDTRPPNETLQTYHSPHIHAVEEQISRRELPNFLPILSYREQKILELFLIQDLSDEKVAKILHSTPPQVKKRYRSVIRKLKEFIKEHNLSITTSLSDLSKIHSSSFMLE